ncbi:MAG TPA: YggS family pyridoxal phosphate-dependent enzyme [Polyangiaceae bacterium]|jgi:pyridoxal phosphate enzyme (YggS family)|nr:YggS family pyridoxal phosphate-dependent enzyme [Polyangiaceae bacterium]
MRSMEERLAALRLRIGDACRRAGRAPEEVTLVAVSKTTSAADVRAAALAGCRDFGENYVQELATKAAELSDLALSWHHIGPLQTNKVKALLACPGFTLLHSLDRPKLLDELERRAAAMGRAVDALVQVNVSGEDTKSGCAPEALAAILEAPRSAVRIRGLMTMPPAVDDPERVRPYFKALVQLRDRHGGAKRLPELSMGMTQDFEVAIEEGATLVRIGTALFGARDT